MHGFRHCRQTLRAWSETILGASFMLLNNLHCNCILKESCVQECSGFSFSLLTEWMGLRFYAINHPCSRAEKRLSTSIIPPFSRSKGESIAVFEEDGRAQIPGVEEICPSTAQSREFPRTKRIVSAFTLARLLGGEPLLEMLKCWCRIRSGRRCKPACLHRFARGVLFYLSACATLVRFITWSWFSF